MRTPGDHTPGDRTPGDHTPGDRTPDDHAPGAADAEDAHLGTAPRAGTAAGIGAGEHHGGYLDSTGTVDGAPQQTPPADQQFGPPSEPGGRQTPPADQQFGRPMRHDAPHSEQDGELPPQEPELDDPQDGSHRG
ncbi:hypothetical protein CFK39_05705 [Brachybacterium avium]|uniref:Uncharacterized protein n=1 Tax=Brachybacterium avium TaxID=2017485 RepID=A0A220UBK2_9MICO|nr:hypothetical protein [Brachybacterium avium]ASK65410.1 hypothetical protein CFK39_05705 [Brachybacterium avium]